MDTAPTLPSPSGEYRLSGRFVALTKHGIVRVAHSGVKRIGGVCSSNLRLII